VENTDFKKIKLAVEHLETSKDDETDQQDRKNSSHNPVKHQAPSLKSNGLEVRYQYFRTTYSLCIQGERWMPYFL
jgi:hypothetical protein